MMAEDPELDTSVRRWLESSGAPFEMKVARTLLAKRVLGVEQSRYFRDPDDDVSREIDLLAGAADHLDAANTLGLWAVIECKYAPTPWVIFRQSERYVHGARSFARVTTEFGREWIENAKSSAVVTEAPLWGLRSFVGYGMTSSAPGGGGDGKGKVNATQDLAYKAARSATKAAAAIAAEMNAEDHTVFGVFLPVVVLRGVLYEAWLDGGGTLAVEQVERGQILWRDPSAGVSPLVVDVVSESALDGFVDDLAETVRAALSNDSRMAANAVNTLGIY